MITKDLLGAFGLIRGGVAVLGFGASLISRRLSDSPLSHLAVTVSPREGGRFSMRLLGGDPGIYREIWMREDYSPEDVSKRDIARGKDVADVGAHIGLFTAYALLRMGAEEVRAFEPDPENLGLLKRNIKLNGLERKVRLHEAAVIGHDANWARPDIDTVGPEALYGCQVIKMDCEGAELSILSSFPTERLKEVEAIVLEYHLTEYGIEGLTTILDRLDGSGFSSAVLPHQDPRWGIVSAIR